jgi:coenzyme F420-reducing hydrogenase delta subunit
MEPLHLMKALEEVSDAAYLVACPEGACQYLEGNHRAAKRVARTQQLLQEIGLEAERVGMVIRTPEDSRSLAVLAKEIRGRVEALGISPIRKPAGRKTGKKRKGS